MIMNHKKTVYVDLHMHSKYSLATSKYMELESIARNSIIKGLNIVGTGDFLHPKWRASIIENLEQYHDTGLYKMKNFNFDMYFLLQVEVNTIFKIDEKYRKIHQIILAPNIETAEQISDVLSSHGSLKGDGRPTLKISASEMLEKLNSIDDLIEVFPAHIWTPWFGLFGSKSGFDDLKTCYEDKFNKINVIETGLSSDPPMNQRIKKLDNIKLISNSDAHSPYTNRIGREATVFELNKISYKNIINSLRSKNGDKIDFTIEVPPQYGKYHWTGHRLCEISMEPKDAIKSKNLCPKCNKKMTIGVEQRVEELADRQNIDSTQKTKNYIYLLPLEELIQNALGLSLKKSKILYEKLISVGGNEYNIMLNFPIKDIEKYSNVNLANAVKNLREQNMSFIPGYDGVYGKINLGD